MNKVSLPTYVILTKLRRKPNGQVDRHNPLRTGSITGRLLNDWPIKVGESVFVINAEPLTEGTHRLVGTSFAQNVTSDGDNTLIIETENSVYTLVKVLRTTVQGGKDRLSSDGANTGSSA